jgi:hypothetical protein
MHAIPRFTHHLIKHALVGLGKLRYRYRDYTQILMRPIENDTTLVLSSALLHMLQYFAPAQLCAHSNDCCLDV